MGSDVNELTSEPDSSIGDLRSRALAGELNRRQVLKRGVALGLTAPVIATLLAACGGDDDDEDPTATSAGEESAGTEEGAGTEESPESGSTEPAGDESTAPAEGSGGSGERGSGDTLHILNWQAPTNLNPHFSQGYHNSAPAQIVLEPLLVLNAAGDMLPILIEDAPTLENGGISDDRLAITFTLLEGLVWSDNTPFTSEDARFTWEWATDPAAAATTISAFPNISDVEVVDERTFIVHFSEPDPAWYNVFSRGSGFGAQILPKHLLQDYMGDKAPGAPFNLQPIGTGPYKVREFRPGDVIAFEVNELYREPDKPYFKDIEFRGGGDATSAARAVLQTGESHYAPNLQIEAPVLASMEAEGIGTVALMWPGNVEHIFFNFTDPNIEVDGARSELGNPHPFLSDLAVRRALDMSCDRESIATQLYGATGEPTSNVITAPENFVSPNTSFSFDLEGAADMLEGAGWTGSPRSKDDVSLTIVYQTSINSLRQRTQDIIKQHWEEIGATVELEAIESSVYFSADAGNPDTWAHFYADVEMATITTNPFPAPLMQRWLSADPEVDIAQKANNWTGRNLVRWQNDAFNEAYAQVLTEFDPAAQAELFIEMNDLIIEDLGTIALINRASPAAVVNKLKGYELSPWTEFTWDIANWYFEE